MPREARAVIGIPGYEPKVEMRRALLHCTESGYELCGLAIGELAWRSARAMVDDGEADVIVTVTQSGHAWEPGVEVAGAGRTVIRTAGRAQRLRQIAALVDSGLSVEEIVRRMRAGSGDSGQL